MLFSIRKYNYIIRIHNSHDRRFSCVSEANASESREYIFYCKNTHRHIHRLYTSCKYVYQKALTLRNMHLFRISR